MKKLIASRKLVRKCSLCDCSFKKGDIYYRDRTVEADGVDVWARENLKCPKCKYRDDQSRIRFEAFKVVCTHPITDVIWDYMWGEAVMEPDHTECRICYTWV